MSLFKWGACRKIEYILSHFLNLFRTKFKQLAGQIVILDFPNYDRGLSLLFDPIGQLRIIATQYYALSTSKI